MENTIIEIIKEQLEALSISKVIKAYVKVDNYTLKCITKGGKYVEIHYNAASDLYDIKTYSLNDDTLAVENVEEYEGVFVDLLANFF